MFINERFTCNLLLATLFSNIMNSLQKIADNIDKANLAIGRAVAWLALAMVLLMFFNVFSRYALNLNLVWQQELVGFMHAILFLSAAGYTLLRDKHVRVDVFYQSISDKGRAIVDIAGTFLFLFPVCFAMFYFSYDFVTSSWEIFEASAEYNGMPGVFALKTFIWFFAGSVALQGLSTIFKSLIILRGGNG
jgi:TRAP-type mannitol/chloroaromatic compound transport system permease small subunit